MTARRASLACRAWSVARRGMMLVQRTHRAARPRPPRSRLAVCLSLAALALYALYPGVAAAQFDGLANSVGGLSQGWFSTIQALVKPTFLMVATVEFCWAAAIWAFERDTLNSLSVEIIKKIITHGFFYAVLLYAGDWVPLITQSFVSAGEAVVGPISADKIIQDGLGVIADLWVNVTGQIMVVLSLDPETIFPGELDPWAMAMLDLSEAQLILTAITCIVIAFAYIVTAAQYFLLQIEAYVLFAAGAMYLGFGGASWGKDYIMKYLNYAVNAGVRLLVLTLTLSLTLSQVGSAGSILAFDIGAELKLMGLALLQAILAVKAPDMAGGLMGFPGSGLTANSVFSSALNTISQVQMIGMAMRGGGGAAHGAAGRGAGEHGPGVHDVGRAANLGNAARSGAPGANASPAEARNAAASVRGLGDAAGGAATNSGGASESNRPPLPPRPPTSRGGEEA